MFLLFFGEWIVFAVALIRRTSKSLATPADQLPPNASRGAAWAGLGIGIVLLAATGFWVVAASIDASRPKGEYGHINGIPISRSDYEACGGNIPDGCPGGAGAIMSKYWARRP